MRPSVPTLWSFNGGYVDTAGFLKKVAAYDSSLQSQRRGELTAEQKGELDRYENQIVSLTGWLVLAYAGPPETTNCGDAIFHDWHLEIFGIQATTRPEKQTRRRSFVRLHRALNAGSTATAYAFNRSQNFSGHRTSAFTRQDTRRKRSG